MLKTSNHILRLCFLGMLTLLMLTGMTCGTQQSKLIQSDLVQKKLPNGNWEVSPAWMMENQKILEAFRLKYNECRDNG